ncbi:MAG: DNA replication/repair protein RecF [Clostridia bacterium]|nr:DNA replication/repair protein RecF [Clostridia bacterium]
MRVKSFRAQNFRNIEKCALTFSENVNVLLGENAQGKTNAVEGIYLFARGKSFRRGDDKELVRFGAEGFNISIEYEDKDGVSTLEYAVFGRERRRRKNGYKVSRAGEFIGSFRAVLFCPDDLNLVKGGPDERREFLNVAISQCYPSYISVYSDYKKALENRNALLKNAAKGLYFDEGELILWSEALARYASYIYAYRKEYIKKLGVYAARYMNDISDGKEILTLGYKSDISDEGDMSREETETLYKRLLSENLTRERCAGVTLFGPHREDIRIEINGKEARSFASQGQQRSVVLALKMSEGEVSRELFSEYPVFLFDDVLSELDERRRAFVLSGMADRQIIITSCEDIGTEGYVINVRGGEFS